MNQKEKGRVFVFDDDADSLQSVFAALRRDGIDGFPEVSEVEVIRHFVMVISSMPAHEIVCRPYSSGQVRTQRIQFHSAAAADRQDAPVRARRLDRHAAEGHRRAGDR